MDVSRAGHWKHGWVPLDYTAAKQKGHGRVPKDFSAGLTFYHGTNAELQPGEHIHTNYGWAHATTNEFTAAGYARARGGQNVYEVEPNGPIEHDTSSSGPSNYRTQHGFKVKRKLGEQADEIYFGTLEGTRVKRALAHEKLGHTNQGLWHHKGMQLPAYIQHIAADLAAERGMPMDQAIATAIAQCRRWAAGGGDVHPDTRAKAAAAIAEWERLRAKAKVTRSALMSGYDSDGLDASWDGDYDLPDLTGLGVADFSAADDTPEPEGAARAARLGTGARFAALKSKLAAKGASDPGALAAWIGRRKYGRSKFAGLASKARKGPAAAASRGELLRFYPLEDIHILTRAEGDGTGRVVEAYATVFDTPAEIHDHQGHYMEVIDPHAFDATLTRIQAAPGGLRGGVKVLFNHGKTMEGVPAPEFQIPLGIPLDVRPEKRGLLTRTEYDAGDPFTDRILAKIKAGTISAQSFVGGIIRSSPELRGPGDRHRRKAGVLTTVRRMTLGLREYGPVLFPAYSGAEILGVRMSLPGDPGDDGAPEFSLDEEYVPGMDGDGAGSTPGEVHPSRDHAHQLLVMRTEQMCREAGIGPLKGDWG